MSIFGPSIMSPMPYPSVSANLASLARWLRHAVPEDRNRFLSATSPEQLSDWLDRQHPQRVARLFRHVLTHAERSKYDDTRWISRIGVSAWRALVRFVAEADPDTNIAILTHCRQRSERQGECPFVDDSPIHVLTGLGMQDICEMHRDLAAIVNAASAQDGSGAEVLRELLAAVSLCATRYIQSQLDQDEQTRTRVPLRKDCTVQVSPDGLLVSAPHLSDMHLRANSTHWDILASDRVIGWAPPLDHIRISRIITNYWEGEWLKSVAWLPASIDAPANLPPGLLMGLTRDLPGLRFRLRGGRKPGAGALSVAAALKEPLATAAKGFPTDVCATWKAICSVAPLSLSTPAQGPLFDPRFWTNLALIRDIHDIRGAATVVRAMLRDGPITADDQRQETDDLLAGGWMQMCCAPGDKPYQALRATLSRCPGDLPISEFSPFLLRRVHLQRPRTTRREFIAALVVARWQARGGVGPNGQLMLMASDAELRAALNWDRDHGNIDSLRSGAAIASRMLEWLDCPTAAETVSSLVRSNHAWRQAQVGPPSVIEDD